MQSVNFYLDQYHPKPMTFDSRFAAVLVVVLLFAFILMGVVGDQQLDSRETYQASKQKQFEKLEADVAELKVAMGQKDTGPSLDQQISTRQLQLNNYRKLLARMQSPDLQPTLQFSYILKQLGEQNAKKLWLTRIAIDGENLTIEGTTTDSQSIPGYVDALKQSDSLTRYFDELQVERDQENQRLVNFSLINGRLKQ